MKARSSVTLKVIMLAAVGLGIGIWTSDIARPTAEPDGYHAFLATYITLWLSLSLLLLCQESSYYQQKPIDSGVKYIMMSSVIGSSWGWQIPTSSIVKHQHSAGPRVGAIGKIECIESACQVDIEIEGRLQMKTGHVLHFNLMDQTSGISVPSTLSVNQSDTYNTYTADTVMPYYDLVYGTFFSDKKDHKFNDWILPLDDGSVLREMLQTHIAKPIIKSGTGNYFPTFIGERTLGTLSDKFKCGDIGTDDLKIKQVYAIQPYSTGGYIQWVPSHVSGLNITICLNINGEICFNGIFRSDEEIIFEHPEFKIKVSEKQKPSVPFTPPLLSKYTVLNDSHVSLSDWRIMHRAIRGQYSYGDIGAVQTSCVWTNSSKCDVGSFPFTPHVNWALKSSTQCSNEQRSIIALIVFLIAAACIAAAIGGGLAAAAKCKHCGFETISVTAPEYQDRLAKGYATVDGIYPESVKRFPSVMELETKNNVAYLPGLDIWIEDFEEGHLGMELIGKSIGMELPKEIGEITVWEIPICHINLVGGISECEFHAQYNGPDNTYALYTVQSDVTSINSEIYLRQGSNVGHIGIQTANHGGVYPIVCVGRRINNQCAKSQKNDLVVNPDAISVVEEVGDTDYHSDSSAWDFSSFWNALDTWWAKLIAALVWAASIVLLIILIVVMVKVGGRLWIIFGAKKVKAKLWRTSPGNFWLEYHINHTVQSGAEIQTLAIFPQTLPDFTTEEFNDWLIVPNMTWRIMQPKIKNYAPCDGCGTKWYPVVNQPVRVMEPYIARAIYKQPPCTICKFSSAKEMVTNVPITRAQASKSSIKAITEYLWDTHMGTLSMPDRKTSRVCREPVIPILARCITASTASGEDQTCKTGNSDWYRWPTFTAMCAEDVEMQDDDEVYMPQNGNGGMTTYKCIKGKDCDVVGMDITDVKQDELKIFTTQKWGLKWWEKAIMFDHLEIGGALRYRVFLRDDIIIYNKGEADIPQEDRDTYGALVQVSPHSTCRGCPIIAIYKIMNLGGVAHPFTSEMWIKMTVQLLSITGDIIETKVELAEDYAIVSIRCKKCDLNVHGRTISTTNGEFLKEESCYEPATRTYSDVFLDGPLTGPCVCFTNNEAICLGELLARFKAPCDKWSTYDNSTVRIYTGTYGCGDDTTIEYKSGRVISSGTQMITNDEWSSVGYLHAGDRITERGIIHTYGGGVYHTYTIFNAAERNCSGSDKWKCIYDDHKGVFWLSVGLPLVFLLLIIVLVIVRACAKYQCKRKLLKIGYKTNDLAESIINMPQLNSVQQRKGYKFKVFNN